VGYNSVGNVQDRFREGFFFFFGLFSEQAQALDKVLMRGAALDLAALSIGLILADTGEQRRPRIGYSRRRDRRNRVACL
jgi:hypothetical protein